MKFNEYYDTTSAYRWNYCYDAPVNYISHLLKTRPVDKEGKKPVTVWFIASRTHFLLYFLHRLNVRPK